MFKSKNNLAVFFTLFFVVAVFMFMPAKATQAQLVTDGLIGYWPLDQATIQGDIVGDVWGKNNGKMKAKLKVVKGQVGEALEFDGANPVDILDVKALNFTGKKALTAMAWVNAASDDPVQGVVAGCCGTIVAQRDSEGFALRYDGRNAGQEMEFITTPGWQGDGGFGAPKFKKGEWHHLTGVLDNTKMLLYVDGQFLKEMPYAGAIASNSPKTEIGKSGDGGFVGLIDEVAIYSKPLSAKEVKQNFQAKQGLAVDSKGKLAVYWGKIKKT